jgi:TolA-binding protein
MGPVFSAEKELTPEQKEKKKRELMERINALEQEKLKGQQTTQKKIEVIQSKSAEERKKSIAIFEGILKSATRDDPRLPDVLFQLGELYYLEDRDAYGVAVEKYNTDMEAWEKKQQGPQPISPIPSYAKTANAYKRLVTDYPVFPRRDGVLYKLGNLFTLTGEVEFAFQSFKELIDKFPKSENLPLAYLRVGEYYFMNRKNVEALEYFQKVGHATGPDNYLLALFRIGSCQYNMGLFQPAAETFWEYVDAARSGKYKSAPFKEEALEYVSISLSDMEHGAQKALEFLESKNAKEFIPQVIYSIGGKNRAHDNNTEALYSYNFLLKNYPDYKDAPNAQKQIVECYVVENQQDSAHQARIKLVENFGPGTKWMKRNRDEKELVEKVQKMIYTEAAFIPLYTHQIALKQKDRNLLKEAVKWYQWYIQNYSSEKWVVYTFHYQLGEVYADSLVDDQKAAAREFDWVASADLSTFPVHPSEQSQIDTTRKGLTTDRTIEKSQGLTLTKVNQEDAGYAALFCFKELQERTLKQKGLKEGDSASAGQIVSLPETQEYLAYLKKFTERFPQSKYTENVIFMAGTIYFSAGQYEPALEKFKTLISDFPRGENVKKATRMLAQTYVKLGRYPEAIDAYKDILSKTNRSDREYNDFTISITGSMFKIAEGFKASKQPAAAVNAFRRICREYPDASIVDKAFFEGANTWEVANELDSAALMFEEMFDTYPKSPLANPALLRSADCLKRAKKNHQGAKIFLKYAEKLPQDKEAVPCMFRAAEMYKEAQDYRGAARTYEDIFQRYPQDKETPGALYNAGLIYEKEKEYQDAIRVYAKLESTFPKSEYAPEAFFSIAINYESLGDDHGVAKYYQEYNVKYGQDRAKIIASYMKAGAAYTRLRDTVNAEKMLTLATQIHKQYGEAEAIDPQFAAEAYFIMGEWAYARFLVISLEGRSEKEIKDQLEKKMKEMKKVVENWGACIALQSDKFTTRATYMIGMVFYDLSLKIANQGIPEKIRDKFQRIYALAKNRESAIEYFYQAQNYFLTNIQKFGIEQGIVNEWISNSQEKFMETKYYQGRIFIDNAQMFLDAPIPFAEGSEEAAAYREKMEEVAYGLKEKSEPLLVEGLKAAHELALKNRWTDSVVATLKEINADNAELKAAFTEIKPAENASVAASSSGDEAAPRIKTQVKRELDRALTRIKGIMKGSETEEVKLQLLKSVEITANRNSEKEQEQIQTLRAEMGKIKPAD